MIIINNRRKLLTLISLLVFFIIYLTPSLSYAQMKAGISATGGLGIFVAKDDEYYMGIGADVYPEIVF